MSRGEKKRAKDRASLEAFNKLPNLQKIKKSILSINGVVYGDRNSLSYQITRDMLYEIEHIAEEKNDEFIKDVIKSVDKYMKASEKQAYFIAKFADENGYKYKN
jgi:hypothetical protein